LVLDPSKAHVSPQFQFKLDDLGDGLTNKVKCSKSQVVTPETVSPWPRKKNEHSTIWKKEPLLSMLGNTTGGAGAREVKVPLMHFPAQKMPPEDNFVFNENEENIIEGEDPPIGHLQTPLLAAEGVTIRMLECSRRPTRRCLESQQQLAEGTVSYSTAHESNEPKVYQEDLILKERVQDTIASKATPKQDTLYLHEDMLAPYAAQFQEAMKKDMNKHTRKGDCRVTGQSDVPCHSKVLLVLWMKDQDAQSVQS
jgi:hypothetical protein